jgi:ABC-2 type transport system permease protein
MMYRLLVLTLNDLAIAFRNKTLQLVFLIPLFVFFSLKMVDQGAAGAQRVSVALLQQADYPAALLQGMAGADANFDVVWFDDAQAAELSLRKRSSDGVLIASDAPGAGIELVVLSTASLRTLLIIDGVTAVQAVAEQRNAPWISAVRALHAGEAQDQTLPTWMLMLALLVGLVILPVQVAEEKEKQLLLGVLQTPVREREWLLAKLLLGIVMSGLGVGFLLLLGGIDLDMHAALGCIAILLAGGFCFSAAGLLLGFLCRSQAGARSLGMIVYLPNLLPAALSDFSQTLGSVAPYFPSFHFYAPMRSLLLEGGRIASHSWDLAYLCATGLAMLLLAAWLMKRRWLM